MQVIPIHVRFFKCDLDRKTIQYTQQSLTPPGIWTHDPDYLYQNIFMTLKQFRPYSYL